MAAGQSGSGRTQLIPESHSKLDDMKYEIAGELGIPVYQGSEDYWGSIPSRDCGRVGGSMVKRMIAMAEEEIANGKMPNKI
ncbi:MAG TPA: acid-soluble spore protein [Clostridiaceae bacterium]|jgi:small acid-soluble spore protein A (major alpha-type SASP)|nr:acid-soluble spore protein [Clostridiaceae bacterium]HBG38605.1 acid-soluble spore protein [Clostridiaceae bacterium]HBN28297.1 acid-soluble spore protein [Clostridiaceae bacterium]